MWSSAFLLPWLAVYYASPRFRRVLWRASAATAMFGFTEPIFVPAYWNPPSLFELARRTGFDVESFVFAFAIGGIGSVLYDTLTRRHLVPVAPLERTAPLHRLHLAALVVPMVSFVPLVFLPWNPIYAVLTCLLLGASASVACRPTLLQKTLIGAVLFLALYAAFMVGLRVLTPGYIAEVWNLHALRGGLLIGIPVEELAFGFAFGAYWTGVYEHFTWSTSVAPSERARDGGTAGAVRARTSLGTHDCACGLADARRCPDLRLSTESRCHRRRIRYATERARLGTTAALTLAPPSPNGSAGTQVRLSLANYTALRALYGARTRRASRRDRYEDGLFNPMT